MKNFNLLIADRQALVFAGIAAILSVIPGINLLPMVNSSAELMQTLLTLVPRVLIIDQNFEADGIDDIIKMAALYPATHILVLSANCQRETIALLVKHRINHIDKNCTRAELIDAVNATAKGEKYLCEGSRKALYGTDNQPTELPGLSSRESEIVRLIADGLTNNDIAEKLFISVHTIKTHRKNIIKKLGFTFKNAAELSSLLNSVA